MDARVPVVARTRHVGGAVACCMRVASVVPLTTLIESNCFAGIFSIEGVDAARIPVLPHISAVESAITPRRQRSLRSVSPGDTITSQVQYGQT